MADFDGVVALRALLARAGYSSVTAALAEHTVFLHPDTVAQTGGSALFPVVRCMPLRGTIGELPDGRRAMFDDNLSPTNAFLWATDVSRSETQDVQFNHLWAESGDRDAYTALWNVCVTPAFLAKTTDGSNHPEAIAALRYRAYDLYSCMPAGHAVPPKPAGYDALRWSPHPRPVANLERVLRSRLHSSPKSRTTIACREIGWLFSNWEPDNTV